MLKTLRLCFSKYPGVYGALVRRMVRAYSLWALVTGCLIAGELALLADWKGNGMRLAYWGIVLPCAHMAGCMAAWLIWSKRSR